tara:strand:- start:258 stop:425 length:168 start_codon:yes stop_codon:yes gene_type:complete
MDVGSGEVEDDRPPLSMTIGLLSVSVVMSCCLVIYIKKTTFCVSERERKELLLPR